MSFRMYSHWFTSSKNNHLNPLPPSFQSKEGFLYSREQKALVTTPYSVS